MIFTRNKREVATGTEYEVRTLGHEFWLPETEFKQEVANGNVFYKANKPVYHV